MGNCKRIFEMSLLKLAADFWWPSIEKLTRFLIKNHSRLDPIDCSRQFPVTGTARPSKTIDCEGGQENDRFANFLTTLTQRPNIEMRRMGYFGFRRADDV